MKKIALITGAGSGVGRKCTLALAADGYSVIVAGRRVAALEETAAMIPAGKDILVLAADVADASSVRNLYARIQERFGRLDLLFNNAGVSAPAKPFEDLSLEEWQTVVDINLTGMFLCAQEAFRLMKTQRPRGGRIVNNGSVSAHVVRLNAAPYNVTKHGVTGLTKTLSLEGRSHDIACGQIDIGNALTEMSKVTERGALQPDGEYRVETHMDAEDVARAVCYMASLPLEANVQWMTVMSTRMPLLGRG